MFRRTPPVDGRSSLTDAAVFSAAFGTRNWLHLLILSGPSFLEVCHSPLTHSSPKSNDRRTAGPVVLWMTGPASQ
ncbi:hypothetical protein GJAV_G00023370 [Gymnothorax javanicus]|nr:hypothetical protein GJAV_G00023370 [Gymnothorax javanicus]